MSKDQRDAYHLIEGSNDTVDDLIEKADFCLGFETYDEICSHYFPDWEEIKKLR